MALQIALTASEARSATGFVQEIPTTAGEKIKRAWLNIDASVADTLVVSAEAKGTAGIITNPVIDGQTYTGSYAVGLVEITDPDAKRAVTITQELIKVTALTSTITTLTNQSKLITKSNEILNKFSLVQGESDAISYVYPYVNPTAASKTAFFGYSDADIATALGLGAGTYLRRDFKEQEDGTGVAQIEARTAVWIDWSTNPTASITTYGNAEAGLGNEREDITKQWIGVSKADLAAAMVELRAGTESAVATAGYVVTLARVSDNGDGSITLTQGQTKILNAVKSANPDEIWYMNPHSYTGMIGTMTQQTIIYENFSNAGLPAGDAPGTNSTISNIRGLLGNGLWGRRITTQTVSWANAFSETEKVANGTFDTDLTSWTAAAGWAQSAGTVLHTAGNTGTLAQDVSVVVDRSYRLQFDISGMTAGSIASSLGGVSGGTISATDLVTNGTFTSALTGWTVGANWAYNADTALHTAGATETLEQDVGALAESKYDVIFTVSGRSAGSVTVTLGGTAGTTRSADGTFTESLTASEASNLIFTPTSDFDGALDNVIVIRQGTYTIPITATTTGNLIFTPASAFDGALDNISVKESGAIEVQTGAGNVPSTGWTAIGQADIEADAYGHTRTDFSRGIPLNSLADVIAAIEADDGYSLTSVSGYEMSNGEGAYSKRQAKTFQHGSGTDVATKPALIDDTTDSGTQDPSQTFVWYRVAHERVSDVYNFAKTYSLAGGPSTRKKTWKTMHADGAVTIFTENWTPNSGDIDWTANEKAWRTFFDSYGKVFEVQEMWTTSQSDADDFTRGETAGTSWTLAEHATDDAGYWKNMTSPVIKNPSTAFKLEDDEDATIVPSRGGNSTGIVRNGEDKWHAYRVIMRYGDVLPA
jgi:hypothetical protein